MKKKNVKGTIYYVYTLSNPRDGIPFYVGKGSGNRTYGHALEASRDCECKKCQKIRGVWDSGVDVLVDYVYETEFERDALLYEKQMIADIGLRNLCNIKPGGISDPVLEWGDPVQQTDMAFVEYMLNQDHLDEMQGKIDRGELTGRQLKIWQTKIKNQRRAISVKKSWVQRID